MAKNLSAGAGAGKKEKNVVIPRDDAGHGMGSNAEEHNSKKAQTISADRRFPKSGPAGAVVLPRDDAHKQLGAEACGQHKGEKIPSKNSK